MSITRVYPKDGRFYYVEDLDEINPRTGRPKQKWHQLTRVDEGDAALHKALAEFHGTAPAPIGNMKARIAAFSKAHFPTLTFGVQKEYGRMFDFIGAEFEDFNDVDVKPGDIEDFLKLHFADKPTARHHYKARLSTFFGWCVRKDFIQTNPCREITVKGPVKRKGKMSDAVYWAMHDALPEIGQLFLEFTFLVAQRPTEPRLMRESWILPDRIRFLPGKTEDSSGEYVERVRSKRIDKILARLRALRAERMKARKVVPIAEQRDPFLFVSEDGTPFTKSGLNSMWTRARDDKAKLPVKVTTRHIKAYALSKMEDDGHDLRAIRMAAVHTTTSMTEHYLNQHRERFSTIVLNAPKRPKP